MGNKNSVEKLLNMYTVLGFFFLFATLALIAVPTSPYIWYRINPDETEKDIEKIVKDVVEKDIIVNPTAQLSTVPPLNTNLPEGYFVLIPSVGINSPISDSRDYKVALKKGTWIVGDYGTPEKDELPIILAAHRFGYTSWSTETRNRISFYNLPKTDIDSTVSVYWNQREYIYKIYAKEESTYISDYSADLILYTCKYYNSPVRIFRYANRVN